MGSVVGALIYCGSGTAGKFAVSRMSAGTDIACMALK